MTYLLKPKRAKVLRSPEICGLLNQEKHPNYDLMLNREQKREELRHKGFVFKIFFFFFHFFLGRGECGGGVGGIHQYPLLSVASSQ